jgi:hypothetical protein
MYDCVSSVTPGQADMVDDGSLIGGLQAFPSWQQDLGYPDGAKIGLLNACSPIAGLFVGPVIQHIDDNFGRKWGVRCQSAILRQCVQYSCLVYSYTLLAGTIVGCIAGVPGVNGYARELPQGSRRDVSNRSLCRWPLAHWFRAVLVSDDIFDHRSRDHSSSNPIDSRALMGGSFVAFDGQYH